MKKLFAPDHAGHGLTEDEGIFMGGAGNEIGRIWGTQWKKNISRIRWELMSIARVRAPESAVEANIGIHLYEGIQSNRKGGFLVDGVSFVCEE